MGAGQHGGIMLRGPVLVATDLGLAADEAIRQADTLSRAFGGPLLACHVLPELLQVRMLFPQFRARDAGAPRRLEDEAGPCPLIRASTTMAAPPGPA